MDDISIPNAAQPIAGDKTIDAAWYRALSKLSTFANSLQRSVGDQSDGLGTKATKTQTVCMSFNFAFPSDGTLTMLLSAEFAFTITKTVTLTKAGTATVTTKIGNTALGGSANSASTSIDSQAHTTDNAVALTNVINVTFASTSSDCEGLCLTIWGTRVLD